MAGIDNPTMAPGYQPVSLPMPAPLPATREANSLWRAGARSFFKDQRAGRVGDILTIEVSIDDKAKTENKTVRSRDNSETAGVPNLFGLEGEFAKKLPQGINPSAILGTNSKLSNTGDGTVDRKEQIDIKLAAVVMQVLPNGNLVVSGKQQVRINFEMRELTVSGIIRPEDISSVNSISYEKIAEARISYGGKGQISDVQQPRYGSQIMDILMPF
jgi:flagellar L-ring protein precursor FlgH